MKKPFMLLLLFTLLSLYGFGQIEVTLNLPNACGTVSTNEPETDQKELSYSLSPNPSNGVFSLKITSNDIIGSVSIEVMSMQGSAVLSEQLFCNSTSCVKKYNLSYLQKGVYIIYLSGKNLNSSLKFIRN